MSSLEQGSPLERANPSDALTEFERKVAAAMNNASVQIQLIAQFKEYMVQYLALNQPPIPISQILGFSQFVIQPADTVATLETTASTTYVDLATAGPTLTGLPDGRYLILFGAGMQTSVAGVPSIMNVQVNNVTPPANDEAFNFNTLAVSVTGWSVQTLSNGGNNTVTAKYRAGGAATATYFLRRLAALRYDNI